MNDSEGVGGKDRLASLQHEGDGMVDVQRTVCVEIGRAVLSFQELHNHVGGAALELADVKNPDDVIIRNPCRRPRLAPEATDRVCIGQ